MTSSPTTHDLWICSTCGVEHGANRPDGDCPICADDRQYVPATGQEWTTLHDLKASGRATRVEELEPGVHALITEPKVGIGHRPILVQTPGGNLLWDPPGYIDDDAVRLVADLGGVAAVVASHPHMYGLQAEWSSAFDDAPVWVAEADAEWVQRPAEAIRNWHDDFEVLAGIQLTQAGGHFPGSALAHFTGADGQGVLLSSDTIFAVEDRTATFLWSYPNRIPLSPAVARRVADHALAFDFDRMYGNFGALTHDAHVRVAAAADLWIAWASGAHDART